jgi:putative DNA primase/helicase
MSNINLLYDTLTRRGITHPRSNKPNASGFLRWGRNSRYFAVETDTGEGWNFGDFVDGWSECVFEKSEKPLSDAEIRKRKAAAARARAKAQAMQTEVWEVTAQRAFNLWQQAQAADMRHDYLTAKQIQAHGAKMAVYNGIKFLVIPARDTTGKIWTLQYISPDGNKRFLSGGKKKGCYFAIGKPDKQIIVCEGYATGASINEATGHAVAVAFDKGNIENVVKSLLVKYPAYEIAIAADNDIKENAPNVGKDEAERIGNIYNLTVFIPHLKTDSKCDFNDMAIIEGAAAVRVVFNGINKG